MEVERREQGVKKREHELIKRDLQLGEREAKLLRREQKLMEDVNSLKRRRETEEDAPAPGQKKFCDLRKRRKQELVSEAISKISMLSRGSPEELLKAVAKRVFGDTDANSQLEELRVNIAEFAHVYLPSLPNQCRIAGVLTQGLTLRDSSALTGVPLSSIAWGRKEIHEGRFVQTKVGFCTLFFFSSKVTMTNSYFIVSLSGGQESSREGIKVVSQFIGKRGSREIRDV